MVLGVGAIFQRIGERICKRNNGNQYGAVWRGTYAFFAANIQLGSSLELDEPC